MKSNPEAVSHWTLEKYFLGDLPLDRTQEIQRKIEQDDDLADRLADLEESNQNILASYPPERMAASIKQRFEDSIKGERFYQRKSFRVMAMALPAAAALAFVIFLTPARESLFPGISSPQEEQTRMKGLRTHLLVYRKAGDKIELLTEDAAAREHDVLQLAYVTGKAEYGVIFSIDGRGVISRHLPEEDWRNLDEAPSLEGPSEVILPFAYELDDAPGYERFFFLASGEPFKMKIVSRAVELILNEDAEKSLLSLPSEIEQIPFTVKKEDR